MRDLGRAASAVTLGLLAIASGASGQPNEGRAAGYVYFEDGTPAAGARLVLVPGGYNTTARADGGFELSAPPGNYTLRASAANTTSETTAQLVVGRTTPIVMVVERIIRPAVSFDPVPFVFLGISMVAVAVGGFFVNRRMAETGLDFNKSVLGGAPARKPFRRRRKKPKA
jgi:hypothetical protein